MKMKHSFILFILSLALSQPFNAVAQTYCMSYDVLSITSTEVAVKISLAGSAAFSMGDANLVLNFNANALSTPTLVSTTLGGIYSPTTCTNPNTGLASVNIDFNGSAGAGLPIATTSTEVARIKFTITNSSLTTGFSVNSTYCLVYNDNNAASPLSIGSGCPQLDVTLPLEWLDFQATVATDKGIRSVNLDWVTGAEYNVQHFIVERSRDGKTFEKVGNFVKPNNTTAKSVYRAVDAQPWSGVTFYRIHDITFGGKESYSVIRSVALSEAKTSFTLSPNPKAKESPLSIQTNWTENYTFNLFDATGKLIYNRTCKGNVELNQLDLAGGFYYYECTTPQYKTSGKLVVPN